LGVGCKRSPEPLRRDRKFELTLTDIPAKAGIHNHKTVFMDSGFCRNDNEG
jgi:hypothetical protein